MAAQYSGMISKIWGIVSHYNHEKYWKMREYVCNNSNIKSYYYLFRIKRMDSHANASMGTHIGFASAKFASPPILPHGLNGIIVSNDSVISKGCTIYHQVTIGGGKGGAPIIGNNVFIGAGAKIIGPITIGDNVKIGAGCVVVEDIPSESTVVMEKPRIIVRK